jgi:hypothetical protein
MRKILSIILLLVLLTVPVYATPPMMMGSTPAAGGAACTPMTTNACTSATVGECGTTYALCEDFGGAVDCGTDAPNAQNCRVTWTIDDAGAVFGGTPISGEGTYSVTSAEATNITKAVAAASDNFYIFLKVNVSTWAADATIDLVRILSADSATYLLQLKADINAGKTASNWKILCDGGTTTGGANLGVPPTTTQYLWIEYEKSSAGTAKCRLYHSTNGTKPAVDINITNGTGTKQAQTVYIMGSAGMTQTIDHIRISSTIIGDSPD